MSFARKLLLPSLAALFCLAAAPRAEARFGIAGSLGSGVFWYDGAHRTPTNLEIMPTYKLGLVNLDLGFKFNLEETDFGEGRKLSRDFVIRPGVRVNLLMLYVRAAIPLRATQGGDYGLLLGLGTSFGLGPISLFFEVDGNFSKDLGFDRPGLDFRAGVQFLF